MAGSPQGQWGMAGLVTLGGQWEMAGSPRGWGGQQAMAGSLWEAMVNKSGTAFLPATVHLPAAVRMFLYLSNNPNEAKLLSTFLFVNVVGRSIFYFLPIEVPESPARSPISDRSQR